MKKKYESPTMRVVEFRVERGCQSSMRPQNEGFAGELLGNEGFFGEAAGNEGFIEHLHLYRSRVGDFQSRRVRVPACGGLYAYWQF